MYIIANNVSESRRNAMTKRELIKIVAAALVMEVDAEMDTVRPEARILKHGLWQCRCKRTGRRRQEIRVEPRIDQIAWSQYAR